VGVAFDFLRRVLGEVGAGAQHPAAREHLARAGELLDVALDLALIERIDLGLVVEVADRARLVRDAEAVRVEREVVADRHAVAHRDFVVRISAGVHLAPRADVAAGEERARIDEADLRAHLARAVLDIGLRLAGHRILAL